MQTGSSCEQYLKSTEVIRIVQSNNETFINRVLNCIRQSRETICRNVITKHYLIPDDMLQLCREDAFQETQITLLKQIQNNHFQARTETCLPYLTKVFRNLYWYHYQQEIKRKSNLEPTAHPTIESQNENTLNHQTEKVKELLMQLGNTDRKVYQLHYLEGMKVREIALLLGIDARSVTKQLMRLHQRFSSLWHQSK